VKLNIPHPHELMNSLGMTVRNPIPYLTYENGQQNIGEHLNSAGKAIYDKTKEGPSLFVVVLPENGNDIYTAVKQ
jgi:eukaryotic translation initiation factor 2C